jgi:hypothetical protein
MTSAAWGQLLRHRRLTGNQSRELDVLVQQ